MPGIEVIRFSESALPISPAIEGDRARAGLIRASLETIDAAFEFEEATDFLQRRRNGKLVEFLVLHLK